MTQLQDLATVMGSGYRQDRAVNSVPLSYRGGTGRPLVLVHGLMGRGSTWSRQVEWLVGHGSVYTYDAPWHRGRDGKQLEGGLVPVGAGQRGLGVSYLDGFHRVVTGGARLLARAERRDEVGHHGFVAVVSPPFEARRGARVLPGARRCHRRAG